MSTNDKTINEEYVEETIRYVSEPSVIKRPIKTPNDITAYNYTQSYENSKIQEFIMTLVEFLGTIIRGVSNKDLEDKGLEDKGLADKGLEDKGYTKGSFFESIQLTAFIILYGTIVYYATRYITPNLISFEIYITHILGFFGILWAITLFGGDNKLTDYQT